MLGSLEAERHNDSYCFHKTPGGGFSRPKLLVNQASMSSMNILYYTTKARPCGTAARDYAMARIVWGAKPAPQKINILSKSN